MTIPTIKQLRQQIDSIDHELIALISKRQLLCKQLAIFKQNHNMPIFQPTRAHEIKEAGKKLAKQYGIDENFVVNLYELIMSESCRIQKKLLKLK